MKPTAKTALVTHRNCLDGTASAVLFVWAGGLKENVFFRDPKGCALSPTEAAPFDEVWFVDLCPWNLDAEPGGGKPWRVIDHHDTNIRRHGPNCANCTFDVTKCGTSLFASLLEWPNVRGEGHYLNDRKGREMISAIEAYDLGRFADDDGLLLADLAACHTQRDMLDLLCDEGGWLLFDPDFRNQARGVDMVRRQYSDNAAKHAFVSEFYHGDRVYRAALVVSPRDFANETTQKMLRHEYVGGRVDIAICVDITRNSVSLRTLSGGPNVAKIAEEYGGGGHPEAAGIGLNPRDAYRLLFEGIFG